MIDRLTFILSQISSTSRVLHIGCCGDEWQFDRVWKEGHPLHRIIADRVGNKRLVGVDVNRSRLSAMAKMGYAVTYGDAEDLINTFGAPSYFKADVVVAGELIEHLACPGKFLNAVSRFMAPKGKLILTTPNAFGFWSWILYGLLGRQEIFPEHTCWYTPATMTNLLEWFNWNVVDIRGIGPDPGPRRLGWLKKVPERIDRLRPTFGVVAQRKNDQRNRSSSI